MNTFKLGLIMIRAVEILCFLFTLVLAGLWITDPEGSYEPFTVLSGLVFTGIDIYRRRAAKIAEMSTLPLHGVGGAGGSAKVGSGYAIGGKGGSGGGPGGGTGGAGGNAEVTGHGFALGGEGGESGQGDRGGKGGRSPFEVLGVPNHQLPNGQWLWEFGRGGDGSATQSQDTSDQTTPSENDSERSSR